MAGRVAFITACALLAAGAPAAVAEDRRAPPRGRPAPGATQPSAPTAAPLWASVPVGVGLGAAMLPFSPVYAAIAAGVAQAPQSRLMMSRVATAVRTKLGISRSSAGEGKTVTVRDFARALNARLPSIVDELYDVPAFLVVDASGKPLKISVGEETRSNLTFAYLEAADALALANGLRTPAGEQVSDIKVVGTSLGEVVKGYLAKRAAAEADGTADEEAEMLIMPGSQETRIAADLISKLGSENSMVPNAVPIYQVDGLTELEGGQGEGKPQPLLCFFRFNDMQARVEKARKAKGGDEKNATAPDAKLRVRLMRLHEVAALAGSERLPGKPQFVPSSTAVAELARIHAEAGSRNKSSGSRVASKGAAK